MFHFSAHSRIHSVGTKNGVPHRIHRVHPVLSHRPCDVSVADVARNDDDAATDGLATTELLLIVMVDGWSLVTSTLISGFNT